MFLDKLWLNRRKTIEKLIINFHPCEIFSEISQIFKWYDFVDTRWLARCFFKWKFVCSLHFWAQEGSIHLALNAIEFPLSTTFSSKGNGQSYSQNYDWNFEYLLFYFPDFLKIFWKVQKILILLKTAQCKFWVGHQ